MPEGLRYKPISEYDTVTRDLAMVVDEDVSCGSLINEIRKACKQVGDAELFDIYRGEQLGKGKKSMAFKITFVPEDKALDAEGYREIRKEDPRKPEVPSWS